MTNISSSTKMSEVTGVLANLTGDRVNVQEIVDTILQILGKNPSDCIDYVADRLGHDFRYSIDNEKFISNMGEVSATDFTEALQETIKYYEKQ